MRVEEEEPRLAVEVNDGLLDSKSLTRDEQVDDGIDKVLTWSRLNTEPLKEVGIDPRNLEVEARLTKARSCP